jgi:hypothetical protein
LFGVTEKCVVGNPARREAAGRPERGIANGGPQDADLLFSRVAYAFNYLGSFQVPQTNSSLGSFSGGHVNHARL